MTHNTLLLSDQIPLADVLALTCSLMEFKTTPGNSEAGAACLQYMKDWCGHNLPFPLSHHNMHEQSLYLGPKDYNAPLLLFSHYDVAEAPDSMFQPFICGEQLYGRGAVDDKYAVALSLVLFREALRVMHAWGKSVEDFPFMLVISGTEEHDGPSEVMPLLQNLKPEFCIALDGGSSGTIVTKGKGVLQLELHASGLAADAATPWMGKNAAEALIGDLLALSAYFHERNDDTNTEHCHPTMTLGKMNAGSMISQVPDKAKAMLDIRFTEKENPDHLYNDLRRIVGGSLHLHHCGPVFQSSPSPWRDALFLQTGAKHGYGHGADAGRTLAHLNFSSVIWGADGGTSSHSTAEHVSIPSLETVWRGLTNLINRAIIQAIV